MSKKHNIEHIRSQFEKEHYILMSNKYIGVHENLFYKCPKGHEGKVRWIDFLRGTRCSKCYHIRKGISQQLTIDYIKTQYEKSGYTLLSQQYKGAHIKLECLCPKGHKNKICWGDFKQEVRCRICRRQEVSNGQKLSIKEIKKSFNNRNYKIISNETDYANANVHQKVWCECKKGHKWNVCIYAFRSGQSCPFCSNLQSKGEKEIIDIYKDFRIIERDRQILKPKELDLYFPEKKIAIEYCGLYWHSDQQWRMTPIYHRNKMDLCAKQNIRLLTIFEDEWKQHKDICISRINNALDLTIDKIYARKCIIGHTHSMEAKAFLKKTHLQGPGAHKVAFGLYHNNELVQVMTFGSPARAHTTKGKRVLEMKRLAGKLNTTIIGGASKLFKKALQYAKDNNYEIIKSYCDLRWGTGNLYRQLGFTKTYETKYTPHYTDGINRWRNQYFAQNKNKTKMTEKEKTLSLGLWKIYDCGHQTWEYTI